MNIRVDLNNTIYDGAEVVFRSPVDCSQVTGLILYYPDNGTTASREFAFADAHGKNVGNIDYLFGKDVVVKIILDLDTNMAFVQNADTNAYLEGRFAEIEDKMGTIIHPLTGDEFNNLALEGKLVPGDSYLITEDDTNDDFVTKGKIFKAKDGVNFSFQMSIGGGDYVLTDADKEEIASMVDTETVPDYIVTEAERVAKAVQATRTAKSLVLPAMADMHLYAGNSNHDNSLISAQYAGMGVAELKKRIHLDFVGYLGDYTGSSGNYTAEQAMNDITAFKETTDTNGTEIWCVGNHDLNYHSTSELLTLDEVYSHIGANADGVKPYENIERGYGYVDFENQKVRVIYLNTCDGSDWTPEEGKNATSEWISPTQLQWLADTALDFTDKTAPSEWGIVIIGHHPLHYPINCFNYAMKILEAYKDGTSGQMSCAVSSNEWQTVTYDFSNVERAEIICDIHGHTHNCGYSKISSTTNGLSVGDSTPVEPWLWRFCIPNISASRYNTGYTNFKDSNPTVAQMLGEFDENGDPVSWTKETGTAKATSFCVVNIDRKNKKIYAHIFGAGVDRIIDYSAPTLTNQIPISTDASGAVYNGKGWKENTKIGSGAGEDVATSGYGATGLIPIGIGSGNIARGEWVIYLQNIEALQTDNNVRLAYYAADKSYLGMNNATAWKTVAEDAANPSACATYTADENGYITSIDVTGYTGYLHGTLSKDAAYFRFCAPGLDGDSIITVNEPIV